jgi:hypothetical protein
MVVLLFPLTAVLLFAGVQTVLWQHARTIAADRANQVAAEVATGELTTTDAQTVLTNALSTERDLHQIVVDVRTTGQLVSITVTADAPGIVLGTHTHFSIHASAPVEGWQPLP